MDVKLDLSVQSTLDFIEQKQLAGVVTWCEWTREDQHKEFEKQQ